MREIRDKGTTLGETPEAKALVEAFARQRELPEDSGEKLHKSELPNDSGDSIPNGAGQRDVEEVSEVKGGSYRDIKNNMARRGETGEKTEVHHMPSDASTNLEYGDGPAIKMDKEDHRKTASCGASREATAYQQDQKRLIAEGKFREVFEMDVQDIKDKFDGKYDDAIAEARAYIDKLESEGRV